MGRRLLPLVWLAMAVVLLVPQAALAAASMNLDTDQKSGELVEHPQRFDGKRLTFRGEVVGERMVRGSMAWLHVNDDAYFERNIEEGQPLGGYNSGQAVWVPRDLTDGIRYYGDHSFEGDIVRVTGRFNAACSEHGGDMDIHADGLEVLRAGHRVVDPVHPMKTLAALVLGALAALLFVVERLGLGPRRLGGVMRRSSSGKPGPALKR